ncbi:hypothetical protein P5673_013792, partial [Acropora cervicornis]
MSSYELSTRLITASQNDSKQLYTEDRRQKLPQGSTVAINNKMPFIEMELIKMGSQGHVDNRYKQSLLSCYYVKSCTSTLISPDIFNAEFDNLKEIFLKLKYPEGLELGSSPAEHAPRSEVGAISFQRWEVCSVEHPLQEKSTSYLDPGRDDDSLVNDLAVVEGFVSQNEIQPVELRFKAEFELPQILKR